MSRLSIRSIVAVAIATGGFIFPVQAADSFVEELNALKGQNIATVGRAELAAGYQKLLDRHPGHPDRAEALRRLGLVWGHSHDSIKSSPDRAAMMRYLKEAMNVSRPGTDEWFDCRIYYLGRLSHDDTRAIEEANSILVEMRAATRDAADVAQVLERQTVWAIHARDYPLAEKYCREILELSVATADLPKTPQRRLYFSDAKRSAAGAMMGAWAQQFDLPKEERLAKMENLRASYPNAPSIDTIFQSSKWLLDVMTGTANVSAGR